MIETNPATTERQREADAPAGGQPALEVEITRHALDRVPLSLIIDDSAPLVNLNYFFLRDRIAHTGRHQRWEDVPVAIPESCAREFGEWCAAQGVRGKYTIVPCPAGLGRIDEGLPLFGRRQIESWLAMCREVIAPQFDITPELLTHTFVLDLKTLRPLPSRIWEQYEWASFSEAEAEQIGDYMAFACQILVNVGLPPQGITSPGGFGGKVLPLYAHLAGEALRRITRHPLPYFFQRVRSEGAVETPVWYADREAGTAVGEIIACIGDWTGSWTGYGEADPDRYITADLAGGRLPQVIAAGDPCVLVSHWQGFYGLHDGDRRGFRTLQTVVARLRELDPAGERTCWRRPSEITAYACARELARVQAIEPFGTSTSAGGEAAAVTLCLDLPARVPDLTLRIRGPAVRRLRAIHAEGQPLPAASTRRAFRGGTYYREPEGETVLLAYTPTMRTSTATLLLE
jgi:hypothetical protein